MAPTTTPLPPLAPAIIIIHNAYKTRSTTLLLSSVSASLQRYIISGPNTAACVCTAQSRSNVFQPICKLDCSPDSLVCAWAWRQWAMYCIVMKFLECSVEAKSWFDLFLWIPQSFISTEQWAAAINERFDLGHDLAWPPCSNAHTHKHAVIAGVSGVLHMSFALKRLSWCVVLCGCYWLYARLITLMPPRNGFE